MKQLRHVLALTLVFCMVFGMVTSSLAVSGEISVEEDYGIPVEEDCGIEIEVDDRSDYDIDEDREELSVLPKQDETDSIASAAEYDYSIVHVDCGRKYFSPTYLKQIIDSAKAGGFNQVELYLSDNQGFRLALDDMNVKVKVGDEETTYDLTPALGDGYNEYDKTTKKTTKTTDGSGKYLTQSEMTEIIKYANGKGIDIVPCINVPGHMGAILEEFTSFRYSGSKSSIDLENKKAIQFALEITRKYAKYFKEQGVKYYNIGADEYANDINAGMGFARLYSQGKMDIFYDFLNKAAEVVVSEGLISRAFNDGIYYANDDSWATLSDENGEIKYPYLTQIQVCYWSSGWGNSYDLASATTIAKHNPIINTNGDYYWILGGSKCTADSAKDFKYQKFIGNSTINAPEGAMFCIWCDYGDTDGADDGKKVADDTAPVIVAFGDRLPTVDSVTNGGGTTDPAGETVTVTVGGTETIKLDGDVRDTVNTYDLKTAVATVDVEYKQIEGTATRVLGSKINLSNATITGVITDGNENYITLDSSGTLSSTTSREKATVFTFIPTQDKWNQYNYSYAIKYDGYYLYMTDNNKLGVNEKSITSWYYSYYDGLYAYSSNYFAYYLSYSDNDWALIRNSSSSTRAYPYSFTDTKTDPVNATVITIKGVAEGTTYITVGGVRYTINVIAENLTEVTPITVEYWITNDRVKPSATGATSRAIAANESTVYSENGALFSELVPATGTRANDVNNTINMVYWKGTRLTSDKKQTTDKGDNKTLAGDDFTYIRYWNEKWSFFSTKTESWEDFNNTDQIVAYYLHKTEVTEEINTEVVDWGHVPPSSIGSSYGGKYILIDYAVKYQSGERSPNSFIAAGKTQSFHCDPVDKVTVRYDSSERSYYRDLNMVFARETANYEVYMITVTPTKEKLPNSPSDITDSYSYEYDYNDEVTVDGIGSEKVIWVDDEANLGVFANAKYKSISGKYEYHVGGDPIIPGVEVYNLHGMLITYYIRAKANHDSLTVHYMDRTNGDIEFYSYPIDVNQGTTFREGANLPEIPEANGIPTHITNGDVLNSLGKTQHVSSVLATMPEISATYRYSSYKCVEVVRSENGKDLYLYYTFKNTHSFVVDFGVPLHLTTSDIAISGNWTSYTATQGKYGTVEYNGNQIGGGITYNPTKIMQGRDEIAVTLNHKNPSDEPATHFIYLYPATNVLYEENVITNPGAEWTTVTSVFTPATDEESNNITTQSAEKLGEENLHGYDDYYSENTGFSGGSAYKATLDASKTATEFGKPLTFEFTGNGFDLISECGPQTGALLVRVYKDGVLNHGFFVDTYFTGDNTGIINSAAADINGVLDYQVPVVRDINLTHGTYKVEVYGYMVKRSATSTASLYSVDSAETYLEQALRDLGLDDDASLYEVSFMDENSVLNDNAVASDVVRSGVSVQSMADEVMAATDNTQYVYVDGIRVYHTIDVAAEPEYTASEQDVTYYDIYDIAKKSGMTIGSYLVYVEGEGNRATLENYHNKGPQNEIYLTSGNTLAFKLNGYSENQINLKSIQISARAVTEEAAFVDNGDTIPIATNTEMYYSVQLLTTSDTKEYYLSIKCPKNTDGTNSMLSIGAIKLPNGVTIAEATESVKADVLRRAKAQDSDEFIPSSFTVNVAESVKAGKRFYLGAQTSIDVDKLIVEYQGVEYEITPDNAELVSLGVADVYTYSCGFKAPKRGVADSVTVTVKAHKAGTDDVYSTPVTYTVVVK